MYLDEATVRALSDDLKRYIVSWWVFDAISPAVRDLFMKEMATILARAPMHFAPENGVAFFEGLGWRVREVRSAAQDAYRLRRLPWPMNLVMMLPLPQPNPRRLWNGALGWRRSASNSPQGLKPAEATDGFTPFRTDRLHGAAAKGSSLTRTRVRRTKVARQVERHGGLHRRFRCFAGRQFSALCFASHTPRTRLSHPLSHCSRTFASSTARATR